MCNGPVGRLSISVQTVHLTTPRTAPARDCLFTQSCMLTTILDGTGDDEGEDERAAEPTGYTLLMGGEL